MDCVTRGTGNSSNVIISFEGGDEACILADEECAEQNLGLDVVLANIEGQYDVLHECGDYGVGITLNEQLRQSFPELGPGAERGRESCSDLEPTGEMVIAQACLLDCGYRIVPFTDVGYVTVAEINGQWFIVRTSAATTVSIYSAPCDCCGVDRYNLIASTNCGASFTDIILYWIDALTWYGTGTLNGHLVTLLLTCSDDTSYPKDTTSTLSSQWSVTATCDGVTLALDELAATCGAGTGTGTGTGDTGEFNVSATFLDSCGDLEATCGTATGTGTGTGTGSCSGCSPFSVSIGVYKFKLDDCAEDELTGVLVKAEACGLELVEGDVVILTDAPDGDQWSIVTACNSTVTCTSDCDLPPDPPLDPASCCGYTESELVSYFPVLTGMLTVASSGSGTGQTTSCECVDLVFNLSYQTSTGAWVNESDVVCGDLIIPAGYLSVTCPLIFTGTGSDGGTGTDDNLWQLGITGFTDYFKSEVATDSCDPIYGIFSGIDLTIFCLPGSPFYDSLIGSIEFSE